MTKVTLNSFSSTRLSRSNSLESGVIRGRHHQGRARGVVEGWGHQGEGGSNSSSTMGRREAVEGGAHNGLH